MASETESDDTANIADNAIAGDDSTLDSDDEPTPDPVPDLHGIHLLEGEEVHHDLRASWSNWSKTLTLYTILSLVSFGLLLPLFIHPWLARRKTRYIVTNQRVIKKKGILSSSSTEYRIDDIRQLQTGSSWMEGLVGKGNIRFSTGAGGSTIEFGGVPNYKSVANTIRAEQQ